MTSVYTLLTAAAATTLMLNAFRKYPTISNYGADGNQQIEAAIERLTRSVRAVGSGLIIAVLAFALAVANIRLDIQVPVNAEPLANDFVVAKS